MSMLTDEDRAKLPDVWTSAKAGSDSARTWLVEHYAWLPESICRQKKVPPHFDRDDVKSWAYMGLFDAVLKFKPETNSDGKLHEHFIGYAKMRINGAILDGMKAPGQTWATRDVWRKTKAMHVAEEALSQELGRPALRSEVATRMGVAERDLPILQQQVYIDAHLDGDHEQESGPTILPDAETTDSSAEIVLIGRRVAEKIATLAPARQQLLADHYMAGLDSARIAKRLGTTPQQARAEHARALGDLLVALQTA